MRFFELESTDISTLSDGDLRELVARLCEAELIQRRIHPSCLLWGGAQEAADGGLDVHVKDAAGLLSNSGFVPRVNTGFQVKKNSMTRAACKKEMLDKGKVKTVISDLADKNGAYIIVSGKDDCSDKMLSERILGMSEAVAELESKDTLFLDFYGSDRLSSWLRLFPGVELWVRSRLGKSLSGWRPFGRWARTPSSQDDEFLLDEHPCVIDVNSQMKKPVALDEGIQITRKRLFREGSVVRITGLSGVGKTRFAQALFEPNVGDVALPAYDVIYADLGNDLTPTASELVSYLIANDFSSYIVLDNCPPDVHRNLQKQASENSAKLRLLTIEYDISDDKPEETDVIHIEPSSEKIISELVQKRFPHIGRINADKIAEFSGGNARIAIALSSRVKIDESLTNFTDEDLFNRLFTQRKGVTNNLQEHAEILSLVYSFNISKSDFNDELGVLAQIGGVERRALYRSHAELLNRQISQRRGNWRAVLPHALANRLAIRALQNIPFDEINNELFKKENLRLFISCAHRLGYLHDFDMAQQLANTWIQSGGPLYDISSCDQKMITVLNHIAPVFPDTVLTAIETASMMPGFASRNNPCFLTLVRLLYKLAYEDESFERATNIILKFAETENFGENNNSIVHLMRHLFSLYLSGTLASPIRRQNFVNRLLVSNKPRYLEIAEELFNSAFEAYHWNSYLTFDFGARKRSYGWEPEMHSEVLGWYNGFIALLIPYLSLRDENRGGIARRLLVRYFRQLWSYAGCFDSLENIVVTYAHGGKWPDVWWEIKKTIYFDEETFSPELRIRLRRLERLAAPNDLYSEIEAHVLREVYDQIELKEDGTDNSEEIKEKVVKLGEIAVSEPKYIKRIAPKIWEANINTLWSFGEGGAKGSKNRKDTFEFLIGLMQAQNLKQVSSVLFCGFISYVYIEEPDLARKLQERVLDIPELKPHFIDLLSATPISSWSVRNLISVARSGEFEAYRFERLAYGRMHEAIPDSDLILILDALDKLDEGIFSIFNIIVMRFFIAKHSNYNPSDELLSFCRGLIKKLLSMHHDKIRSHRFIGSDSVINKCLSGLAPEDEVCEIIELLCDGIENYRLCGSELTKLIDHLIITFPEIFLNRVFNGDDVEKNLAYLLFRDSFSRSISSLNVMTVAQLAKWCGKDEKRILAIASNISVYIPIDKKEVVLDNTNRVKISEHAQKLLNVSEDKIAVINIFANKIKPNSWSGSRADILEIRLKAFAEFQEHQSSEVREFVKGKIIDIENLIHRMRQKEAEEDNQHEQRFE